MFISNQLLFKLACNDRLPGGYLVLYRPLRFPHWLEISKERPLEALTPAFGHPIIQTLWKLRYSISHRGVVRNYDEHIVETVQFLKLTSSMCRQGNVVPESHVKQCVC